jgi:ribosome-binding protein aMBF1 (putative translation factor)
LARLTFTQRTVDVPLATKTEVFRRCKPVSAGNMTFGQRLVEYRKERGFTQKEVAEKTGIPRKWLGRWERGRAMPNEVEWQTLAKVLKLPVCI